MDALTAPDLKVMRKHAAKAAAMMAAPVIVQRKALASKCPAVIRPPSFNTHIGHVAMRASFLIAPRAKLIVWPAILA